jgi:molybdopterin molybdotransferase
MRQNLSVEEALSTLSGLVPTYRSTVTLPLAQSYGQVLARDLIALVNHPDQADTSMDGYAVRLEDTLGASPEQPVVLEAVGEVAAGSSYPGSLQPGQAVRIFTGAPVPAGTTAIVRIEQTRSEGTRVALLAPGQPGDIRPQGDDFRQGEVGLLRGQWLGPGQVGLAAAMGHPQLEVFRAPRVGILTTGDEVVEPGQPLPFGGVYNANNPSLAGLVLQAGGQPVMLGKVADQPDALRQTLQEAGPLDLIVSSGGVSMGAYDYVRQLLEREGEVHFWRVNLQPGGPFLAARWQGLPFFGLPGNPVSSMVTFFLFVRPFLFQMLQRIDPPYTSLWATSQSHFAANPGKVAFRRGILQATHSGLQVHSTGNQSSGVLRSMAAGNVLVRLEVGQAALPGDQVNVIPLNFSF